jgi:hypothetical protein
LNLKDPTQRISRDEILGDDPLLGLWMNRLYPLSSRSLLFFLIVTLIPLALLILAAGFEQRLYLHSMDCSLGKAGTIGVPGMSFLGDSMVWPYVILIPCAFAMLARAVSDLSSFFQYPERIIRLDWLREKQGVYEQILADVRETFNGRDLFWRRLRTACVVFGLLLFFFNAITCTLPFFSPHILSFYTPYGAHLIKTNSNLPPCQESIQGLPTTPPARVPLQKWDTQAGVAPFSWFLARLWVLFLGYTWLPLLCYKISNLVFGLRLYLRRLTETPDALHIQPLSPDAAGGLSVLSAVAFSLVAPLICVGVMLTLIFVKEHAEPSKHDLILFFIVVPIVLVAFYLPLLSVHSAMKACKDKQLSEFSLLFNGLNHRLLTALRAETIDLPELNTLEVALRCLRDNYERLIKMPVWPFGLPRLVGLVSSISATALPLFIQTLVKKIYLA